MTNSPKSRQDVLLEDRWDIEALYASNEAWEEDFRKTEQFAGQIESWAGRLSESAANIASALAMLFAQERLMTKLMSYAHLARDQDLSKSKYQDMVARITTRATTHSAATSFFIPELLEIEEEKMSRWLETQELRPYVSWLENQLRYRPHTLGENEERLLAMAQEPLQGFSKTFGLLHNSDSPARLPEILNEHGKKTKLTNSNFGLFLESKDQKTRMTAFAGFYRELESNSNTLSALLDSQVRAHVFSARAKNYKSALEASLFKDRVNTSVYDSLISAVHEFLGPLHRYLNVRKKLLKLDRMHVYDSHAPIVDIPETTYTFDEGVDMTLEAVAPLGREYVDTLSRGFADRWVDKFENRGKRSGAYSGGCYDSYPYILHNFNGTLSSVFTLAHEAGHSMHTWLANANQPYHTAEYRILVAEVASITNEMLLIDRLLNRTSDPKMRAHLINHLVSGFRSTVYRQTMFAEFEREIHDKVESGGSLTPDYLNETYYDLVKLYHGDALEYDDQDRPIELEWGRVPHFYYNFYVYKYATGKASAVDIASRILAGDKDTIHRYLEFLKGGASKPPLDLLRDTGVDLTTETPVKSALSSIDGLVDELETLLTD